MRGNGIEEKKSARGPARGKQEDGDRGKQITNYYENFTETQCFVR